MTQALGSTEGIQNRYAVCVGIDTYKVESGLEPLRYAEKDATAVNELLGRMGFAQRNRRLLLGEVASFEAIKAALTTFGAVKPQENDLVIFYFAGYSLDVQIDEDEGTILLSSYDFDLEQTRQSLEYRMQKTLRLGMLREIFENSRSKHVLFIFDTVISGDYEISAGGFQISINWVFANRNPGRVAISSCLPIEEGIAENEFGHGLFAHYLIEVLEGKVESAKRDDGAITVGTLFKYLYNTMPPKYRPVQSSTELDKLALIHGNLTYHQPDNTLVMLEGPEKGRIYYITSEITSIGRNSSNDLIVMDHSVSRQHAEIRLMADHFVLFDMGSFNGTIINGQPLPPMYILNTGDEILLGNVRFAFKGGAIPDIAELDLEAETLNKPHFEGSPDETHQS